MSDRRIFAVALVVLTGLLAVTKAISEMDDLFDEV